MTFRSEASRQHLTRIGAIAALTGAPVLFVATLLHPMNADPNNSAAAFSEYAADRIWVATHLGQFVGIALLGVAMACLATTVESGKAAAWGFIGAFGTAASIASAAALQAVDGIALHTMVHHWADAAAKEEAVAFESAFAVRQVEIGLASLLSILFGLSISALAVSLISSRRYATWLGWIGLLGGLGTVAGGVVQAYTGFSGFAMAVSMPASSLLLIWAIAVGTSMWRRHLESRQTDQVSLD
jgi:hypothetical protein